MDGVITTVAGSASDPESTRVVYAVVVALVAVGVALVGLAIWLFRQTRPDPELLAPLDRMSSRSWRRLEPAERRRVLDAERPAEAQPMTPARRVPTVDDRFDERPPLATLDDLRRDDPLVISTTLADPAAGVVTDAAPDDATGEVDDPVAASASASASAADAQAVFDPPLAAPTPPVSEDAPADRVIVPSSTTAADDDSEVVR